MKFLIDIDEHSKKGKLTLDLLKELGVDSKEMPSATNYAFPSNRKITSEELNYLLDEAEISENLILKEEGCKVQSPQKVMRIEIKAPAMKTLKSIADWVETKNTAESGDRYMNKFYDFIVSHLDSIQSLPYCKSHEFKIRKINLPVL